MNEDGLLPELKLGRYVSAEGHVLARGALGLTAYLDRGDLWARGGAARILELFIDRVPRDHLRFLSTSLMQFWKGVDEKSLPEVQETLRHGGVLGGVRHLFWMRLASDPGAPALGFTYTEIDPKRSPRAAVLEL